MARPLRRPNNAGSRDLGTRILVTLKDVKRNETVRAYLEAAHRFMGTIGFTEHGFRHAELVSLRAEQVLRELGLPDDKPRLAGIAGYLHDIGNVVSRENHVATAAFLVSQILTPMGMPPAELAYVLSAVGNHEEPAGEVMNEVGAAVVIADKSDVHRSRVMHLKEIEAAPEAVIEDIHDRVNYAVTDSVLEVDAAGKLITLSLQVDTRISSVMEYFEIFLDRMVMSRRAAESLGCRFRFRMNETALL